MTLNVSSKIFLLMICLSSVVQAQNKVDNDFILHKPAPAPNPTRIILKGTDTHGTEPEDLAKAEGNLLASKGSADFKDRFWKIFKYIHNDVRNDVLEFVEQVAPESLFNEKIRADYAGLLQAGLNADVSATDSFGQIVPMTSCQNNRPTATQEHPNTFICFNSELITSLSYNSNYLSAGQDPRLLVFAFAMHEYARHFKLDSHDFEIAMIEEATHHYLVDSPSPIANTDILKAHTVDGKSALVVEKIKSLPLHIALRIGASPQAKTCLENIALRTGARGASDEITALNQGYPATPLQGLRFQNINPNTLTASLDLDLNQIEVAKDEYSGEMIRTLEVINLAEMERYKAFLGLGRLSSDEQSLTIIDQKSFEKVSHLPAACPGLELTVSTRGQVLDSQEIDASSMSLSNEHPAKAARMGYIEPVKAVFTPAVSASFKFLMRDRTKEIKLKGATLKVGRLNVEFPAMGLNSQTAPRWLIDVAAQGSAAPQAVLGVAGTEHVRQLLERAASNREYKCSARGAMSTENVYFEFPNLQASRYVLMKAFRIVDLACK